MRVNLLGEVNEFARLHLDRVIVVDNVVSRLEAAVMEVLVLIDSGVYVVSER